MKTFGLILIFVAMAWSWMAFYSPSQGVSEQTMIQIQNSLQDQVLKVMAESPLKLNNIVFKKFWTKQISEDQVQAQFLIAFDEESEPATEPSSAGKLSTDTSTTNDLSDKQDEVSSNVESEEFESTTTKVERKGRILLSKADESDNEQVWVIESIKIDGESIEFQKGLKFSAKSEN